jgi:peptidoglycan glycosyltransferase
MASYPPTYDPNLVDTDFQSVLDQSGAPLLNRATQGLYPPGSTFKIVTAAAALDHGQFQPESEFKGGRCVRRWARRCATRRASGARSNTLADALVHSYNTTFAQIGQQLGQDRLVEQMQAFGFYSPIPIDYPREQMATSGIYRRPGKIASPDRKVDVSRVAIGQAGLLATPLQMAMVTATIANGGVMMAPRTVDRIRGPWGGSCRRRPTRRSARPSPPRRPLDADRHHAAGRRRGDRPGGPDRRPQVAGGRRAPRRPAARDSSGRPLSDAWFVAFAPMSAPKVAIAVRRSGTPPASAERSPPVAAAS